jgi:two-component system response regulator FixJ
MMKSDLFVADADAGALRSISMMSSKRGWSVRTFIDGASLLSAVVEYSPSCIVVDLHLPNDSSLGVIADLRKIGAGPVLAMSGSQRISVAVDAMKHGAADFIQKPFDELSVVEAITHTVYEWRGKHRTQHDDIPWNLESYPFLTSREVDVLKCIASGSTSRASALSLNLSQRTVEFYRARLLRKLGAKNSADLVRIAMG